MHHTHPVASNTSMCLTGVNDLTKYRGKNGTHPLSLHEYDEANCIFMKMWPKLDHTRKYCIHPLVLATELLKLNNQTPPHLEWWCHNDSGINRIKQEQVTRMINDMWQMSQK